MLGEAVKVLIVEEDPIQASFLFNTLCPQPPHAFRTFWVDSYTDARLLLHSQKMGAIVLDLGLPGEGTADVLLRLQADAPSVPVVALLKEDDADLMTKALRAGAQDCLVKGRFDSADLQRSVLHAIERHRFRKELHFLTDKYRQANLKLKQQVKSDPLTGLMNRRGLQEALNWESARSKRQNLATPVIFMDIDDFKSVNDRFGHVVGDQVLASVGRAILGAVTEEGCAARVGGDEFLLILPQCLPTEAVKIAERIRLAVANSPVFSSQAIVMATASLGLEFIHPLSSSIEELLALTRLALQKAKRLGGNRMEMEMTHYETEVGAGGLEGVIQALRLGDRFKVMRQPIRRLQDAREVGYQFACRLGVKGFERAEDYYNASLDADILTLVDKRCFDACLAESGRLNPRALCHVSLLPSTLAEIPAEELLGGFPRGRDKQSYCLEINEQQVYDNTRRLREPVKSLKRAGVLVAMNGVGGGQSRLDNLLFLEPDVLKLDRGLVRGVSQNEDQQTAVRRLLEITRPLRLDVLAEGIETKDDLDVLKDMGVQYGQGALWGRATAA